MEASVQIQSHYRLGLPAEELLDGNTRCPLCGDDMNLESVPDSTKQTLDGCQVYVCYNPGCSYNTQSEVRDVIAALIESGRTPLMAVSLAASYTATDAEPISADRFHIVDKSSANWVLKQMANIQRQIDSTYAMINEEMATIAKRGEKLIEPLMKQLAFFENAFGPEIEDWLRQEIKDQKSKSVKLLHGSVGFRKTPDKLFVDDDKLAVIELAEQNGFKEVFKIKKEINTSALKSLILNDEKARQLYQQLAHIEPGTDTFYIKPELPEA